MWLLLLVYIFFKVAVYVYNSLCRWPNPPNQIPYNNSYQHQPDFRYNSFGCATEYNKTPTTPTANVMNSPWSNMQNSIVGNQVFDGTHQGLSLRQAMLKETQNIISPPAPHMNPNVSMCTNLFLIT